MISTFAESRDAIGGLIVPAWNTATSSATLLFDNLPGDRPDPPALFGRLTIRHTEGSRVALGNSTRFRRSGTIFLQIFVPSSDGMGNADSIVQTMVETIEDAGQVQNMWFRDVRMREVGSDGAYHQVNVEAGFTFDRMT